ETGSMDKAQVVHTATLLPSGEVLVAAGFKHRTAEVYDPASGTWTATGRMVTVRSNSTATLLRSGRVLVAAGSNFTDNSLNSAELYDPATQTWTGTANLGTARNYHTATLLPSGKVLVAGGATHGGEFATSSAELYDEGLNFD